MPTLIEDTYATILLLFQSNEMATLTNLREPMKAGRGVHKVHTLGWEQPPIK